MKKIYKKVKGVGVGFLDWCELGLGGGMYRAQLNHELSKHYRNQNLAMPKAFKEEVRAYWKPYTTRFDMRWQYYFSYHNGEMDPRHIPEDLHFTVFDRTFNNRNLGRGISEKNYIPLLFPEIKQPKNLVRKINGIWMDADFELINLDRVLGICRGVEAIILKPSIGTGGGHGIQFWHQDDGDEVLKNVVASMGKNVIVQEFMKQHKNIAQVHPSSVNTIRAVTFYFQGEVHLLSAVLRMGKDGGQMDNGCAGGISSGIRSNGRLKTMGFNLQGQKFDTHPQGTHFEDCVIPNFPQVVEVVKRSHNKLLHSKLVTWDIAIDEQGEPVIIEFNLFCGGIAPHQLNNGPLYGEMTEAVLKDVFAK